MLNYAHQFIKIRLVFHTPYLWKDVGDPQFLFHFWNRFKSLSVRGRSLKKIYRVENFCANVLKVATYSFTIARALRTKACAEVICVRSGKRQCFRHSMTSTWGQKENQKWIISLFLRWNSTKLGRLVVYFLTYVSLGNRKRPVFFGAVKDINLQKSKKLLYKPYFFRVKNSYSAWCDVLWKFWRFHRGEFKKYTNKAKKSKKTSLFGH